MTPTVPPRSQADPRYIWNAESVFATTDAWEAELQDILAAIPTLKHYQARLGESPATVAEAITVIEELFARANRVYVYAGFAYSVDTTNQAAAAMQSRAQGMYGELTAAAAFLNPELLALGRGTLDEWARTEVRLAKYEHFFDDVFRRKAHTRSAEVEEVLGLLADPFSGPTNTAGMLTNADFRFRPGADSAGNDVEVTEGSFYRILAGEDRKARQTTWESYMDQHVAYKNTLASNLASSVKQNVFLSRVRRHKTALAMGLFDNNIPEAVFHNLIAAFQKKLPVWQRYFEIRRRALNLETLETYDLWAPLVKSRPAIPFEQAVDWIAEGLLPMGKDYVGVMRNGCLEERWVDVYPNQGKRTGAFSWGAPGTHPFIMMSYTDDIFSLSTLAHELGHSMHSYLTWQTQPLTYSDYSLFVAEVASNFHQAMVRAHLLRNNTDRNLQISIIEEAMANFLRYFFIMPTLARFELETHTRVEQGEALTAQVLAQITADLFEEGYGGKVHVDRDRVGMTWAYFPHMFVDYYVYAYATGLAGAHALSNRVLRGEPNAVEAHLGFLKSGSSDYPLEVLRRAGVDLASPEPVEETFAVMEGYIDRLEQLLNE